MAKPNPNDTFRDRDNKNFLIIKAVQQWKNSLRKYPAPIPGLALWKGFLHSKGSWTAGFLKVCQVIKILKLLLEQSSSGLAKAVATLNLSLSVRILLFCNIPDSAQILSSSCAFQNWTLTSACWYPPFALPLLHLAFSSPAVYVPHSAL